MPLFFATQRPAVEINSQSPAKPPKTAKLELEEQRQIPRVLLGRAQRPLAAVAQIPQIHVRRCHQLIRPVAHAPVAKIARRSHTQRGAARNRDRRGKRHEVSTAQNDPTRFGRNHPPRNPHRHAPNRQFRPNRCRPDTT
jgi:hypothetical protein